MNSTDIITRIIDNGESLDHKHLLDLLLPHLNDSVYSLDHIDQALSQYCDQIEELQRIKNDEFDEILDEQVQRRLRNLSDDIGRTQSDVNSLQEAISGARERYESLKGLCHNDQVVREREEMLKCEQNLKLDLQKSKFFAVLEFFRNFSTYLEASLETCKKISSSYSANCVQIFDWANYHQEIFLLRTCGQTVHDLDRLEALFQRCKDMLGLAFRQPVNKMDFNNFIEFHTSYSLESQVDVILNSHGDRCELGRYFTEPKIESILKEPIDQNNRLFGEYRDRFVKLTVECCRLLIDLNVAYIESHLTDGINIDKLNGQDSLKQSQSSSLNVLPSYAFSPQDYITQIGQHLLALKKQTEKFDQIEGEALLRGLNYLEQVKNCDFVIGQSKIASDIILRCVARQVIRSLVGRTTASVLSQLNANGLKQIATDSAYLNDVLTDLNLLDASDQFVVKFKNLFINSTE